MTNYMQIKFKAISENEAFARSCAAAFCLQCNPSVDEVNDIKTAISEAITNAVVHAYPKGEGEIEMRIEIEGNKASFTIRDYGVGIKDIAKAREAFFTTKPNEERSGIGFTIMETFMDELKLRNCEGSGVEVTMQKTFNSAQNSRVC